MISEKGVSARFPDLGLHNKGGFFIPQNEEVPHYVGHRKRLKDRFSRAGLDSFKDYEVVEFILTYALAQKDTKPLAKDLIRTFGSLRGIVEAPVEKLKEVKGLGEHSALLFKLIKAASERYLRDRFLKSQNVITSPGDLISYCQSKMGWLKDEQFRMIYLNTRNQVIEEEVLQEGNGGSNRSLSSKGHGECHTVKSNRLDPGP